MNGIYLSLLLREIENNLIDLSIDKITQMNRLIQIVVGQKALFVSLFPEAPAIFVAERLKSGFEKLQKLSEEVESSRIVHIEQPHFMPVVKLQLAKTTFGEPQRLEVIVSLYREAPNLSVKYPHKQKNLFPRYIEKKPKKSILELTESQLASYGQKGTAVAGEYLIREIEGIDKYLAGELTQDNLKRLKAVVSGEKARPKLVSISPLRLSLFATDYIKVYASFNSLLEESIKKFVTEKSRVWAESRKGASIKNIQTRISRLQKKLVRDEEIEQHRMMGELLLSNLRKIKKGEKEVQIFNPYTQKNCIIALDPLKTAQENAQVYFRKYKKLKRGQPKIKQKIATLKKEIEEIRARPIEIPSAVPSRIREQREQAQPFRSFHLASGSVVYVGKSARSNEELTFTFARPNDYFFHIRGYGGSHTVLKANVPKGQKPKRQDIETAASIAAYFSKLKRQKNVPVSYTQRKYLKKNKKGKPGSVILMREEVVFVDPQLPEESS